MSCHTKSRNPHYGSNDHARFGYRCMDLGTRKEGNVLFNDTLNTFYLRLYGVGSLDTGAVLYTVRAGERGGGVG